MPTPYTFENAIGVRRGAYLLPVPFDCEAVRDNTSGRVFPVQYAPPCPLNETEDDTCAWLARIDDDAPVSLSLEPCEAESPLEKASATVSADKLLIQNGEWSVRLPDAGEWGAPLPAPLSEIAHKSESWPMEGCLVSDAEVGMIRHAFDFDTLAPAPCFLQWRTRMRWGRGAGVEWVFRWMADSDTILIAETVFEDDGGAWLWYPFGKMPARILTWGGGEGKGPMREETPRHLATRTQAAGPRRLQALGHIGYYNQWCKSWIALADETNRFAGLFSAMGSRWQRRGAVRPEAWEDEFGRAHFRFPLHPGRRIYGLTLSADASTAMGDEAHRCQPNRRKVAVSDLRASKTASWDLDPPLEPREMQLLRPEDLTGFRERISQDPDLGKALARYLEKAGPKEPGYCAAALWKGDEERLRQSAAYIAECWEERLADIADGGYDRLIIFDGRIAKRMAYDADLLWALGHMTEAQYRTIRRPFLALAYMYADRDYCNYDDFLAREGDPGCIRKAMRDEMGDCPVPPNFAAEYFTTTGVMAELYPSHRMAAFWREWAAAQLEAFLHRYFEEDGTYLESINYHSHCFNEMICQLWPLALRGGRNLFDLPRVKGCFRHFAETQMPPLTNCLPDAVGSSTLYAAPGTPRSPMPADGNSGNEGCEQDFRGELSLGAAVYRDSDPSLSRQLMHAWRAAGKPLLDHDHPLLTLLTLDPALPVEAAPWRSVHRQSLGLISKAERANDNRVYCLFRAGRATHHMDFDQGNLHLACGDKVLLGDHGYHTHDSEGKGLPAASTWLHNCVTYDEDRNRSCGYEGLEVAPEPLLVHREDAFDWCVHRIANDQVRDLAALSYRHQVPVDPLVHWRHYLFIKPHYVFVWDVFDRRGTFTAWWHPTGTVREAGARLYRSGEEGGMGLDIHDLAPCATVLIENEWIGPLWSLAWRHEKQNLVEATPTFATLLHPRKGGEPLTACWEEGDRTLRVEGDGWRHRVVLPAAGTADALPVVHETD